MKQIVSFILVILIVQSCFSGKHKMEERIINYFKDEYRVDVNVIKITRAWHLNWNSFQYTVHFKDAPFVIIQNLYNSKEDKFLPINIGYYLTQYRTTKYIADLDIFNRFVTRAKFRVKDINDGDYKKLSNFELGKKYKDLCDFNIHIYCFDYNTKEEVEWHKFQSVIDYLKNFSDVKFSFMFSSYPPETFNTGNLYANDFGFSYDYHGFDTSFEGVNLNKRLDHMEYTDIGIDSLEAIWNAKLLEVEMQKEKD